MSETLAGRKRSAPDDDDAGGRTATSAAAGLPSPSNAPRPDEEAGTKASEKASKTNEVVEPLFLEDADDLTPEACEQFYNLFGFISGGFWRKDLPGFLKRLRRDLEAYPIFARLYSEDGESLLDTLLQSVSKSPDMKTDNDFHSAMKCLIEANPSVLLWKERHHLKLISKEYLAVFPWIAEKFPWILDLCIEPLTGRNRPPHFSLFDGMYFVRVSPRARRQREDQTMQFYQRYPQGLAQKDFDGSLPLHRAVGAFKDNVGLIKWMAEQYPGGLSSQNNYGETPLHTAVKYRSSFEVVQWLASQYPDAMSVVSSRGQSPLDLSLGNVASVCVRPNDSSPSSLFERTVQVSEFLLIKDPSKLLAPISHLGRVWCFCHKLSIQDLALKLLRVLIGKRGGTVDLVLTQCPFPKAIVPLIAKEFQIISERDRIRKAHILLGKYAEKDSSLQKSEPSPKEEDQSPTSPSQQLFVAYRIWMNDRLSRKVSETPRIVNIRKSIKAIQEEFVSKGINYASGDTHGAGDNFLVADDDDDDIFLVDDNDDNHWD